MYQGYFGAILVNPSILSRVVAQAEVFETGVTGLCEVNDQQLLFLQLFISVCLYIKCFVVVSIIVPMCVLETISATWTRLLFMSFLSLANSLSPFDSWVLECSAKHIVVQTPIPVLMYCFMYLSVCFPMLMWVRLIFFSDFLIRTQAGSFSRSLWRRCDESLARLLSTAPSWLCSSSSPPSPRGILHTGGT